MLGIMAMLLASAAPAQAEDTDRRTVAASGCETDGSDPLADVREDVIPGSSTVATLSGGGGGDLGDLCVAVIDRAGRVTARTGDGSITVEDEVAGLSRGSVSIDHRTYRTGAGNDAIGVRVSGYYVSTSTQVNWTTLVLLERRGAILTPVLTVKVDDATMDKDDGTTDEIHWTVAVDRRAGVGYRDILLTDDAGRMRRFAWTRDGYVEQAGRRR